MPTCPACGFQERSPVGPCSKCGSEERSKPVSQASTDPVGHRETRIARKPPEIHEGQVLGEKYKLVKFIDAGGFGTVYEAERLDSGETVAVKVLRLDRLGAALSHSKAKERFLRGARVMAKLKGDPHIVSILDVGEEEGVPWFSMEYLPDGTLLDLLTSGPLTPARAAVIFADVARALVTVHAAEMIHRDVKPANIFMRKGRAILGDFDIALVEDWTRITSEPSREMPGTPVYMAPESLTGDAVDSRADLFSLGSVLYEALTGRILFHTGSHHASVYKITSKQEVDLSDLRGCVPDAMLQILKTSLAKQPKDRYGSAAEMEADLRSFLEETRTVERKRRARTLWKGFGWATALIAITAGILWVATNREAPNANPAVDPPVTINGGGVIQGDPPGGSEDLPDQTERRASGDSQTQVGTFSLVAKGQSKADTAWTASGAIQATLHLEAISLFHQATETDPSHPEAWFELGSTQVQAAKLCSLTNSDVVAAFQAEGMDWNQESRRTLCLDGIEAIRRACDLGHDHEFCSDPSAVPTCN